MTARGSAVRTGSSLAPGRRSGRRALAARPAPLPGGRGHDEVISTTSGDGCVVITRWTRAPDCRRRAAAAGAGARCRLGSQGRTCRPAARRSAPRPAAPRTAAATPVRRRPQARPGRCRRGRWSRLLPIRKIDRRRAVDRRPHVGHAQDLIADRSSGVNACSIGMGSSRGAGRPRAPQLLAHPLLPAPTDIRASAVARRGPSASGSAATQTRGRRANRGAAARSGAFGRLRRRHPPLTDELNWS